MRELSLIVQTSLDGYVAGTGGKFDDFLGGEENLAFVCDITDDADDLLLGRISYQLLNKDWPSAAANPAATKNMIRYANWYNAAKKYVLSSTLTSNQAGTVIIGVDPARQINEIKQLPGKTILAFGSPTAVQSLLALNLLDSFWIIIHPVLFGSGIPFFRQPCQLTSLRLAAYKQLSNGTVCHKYAVQK